VNHIGFRGIKRTVTALTAAGATNALSQNRIVATLQANWFNGTDLSSQQSIAKSLSKLNLNAANASDLAKVTGVDPGILTVVATSIAEGTPLSAQQGDVYARFDLIVTALLDETYQRCDNIYRNWTRALAALVAVGLAFAGGYMLKESLQWPISGELSLAKISSSPKIARVYVAITGTGILGETYNAGERQHSLGRVRISAHVGRVYIRMGEKARADQAALSLAKIETG
jgi:hypothetical protein